MNDFISRVFRVANHESVTTFLENLQNQKFSFLGKNPLINEEIMDLIKDTRSGIDSFSMT